MFIKWFAFNGIIKDWVLYCSLSQHEKLVQEFNKCKGIITYE